MRRSSAVRPNRSMEAPLSAKRRMKASIFGSSSARPMYSAPRLPNMSCSRKYGPEASVSGTTSGPP
jgi:hypothetical protein